MAENEDERAETNPDYPECEVRTISFNSFQAGVRYGLYHPNATSAESAEEAWRLINSWSPNHQCPVPESADVNVTEKVDAAITIIKQHAAASNPSAPQNAATFADAAEALWGVVVNTSGGDWARQTVEWQGAAARGRDLYYKALDAHFKALNEKRTRDSD